MANCTACTQIGSPSQVPVNLPSASPPWLTPTLPMQGGLPLILQSDGAPPPLTVTSATSAFPDPTATLLASRAMPVPTIPPAPEVVTYAVIGDYGGGGRPEGDIAELVKSWAPDLIVTTGDNNYPNGAAETGEVNIVGDRGSLIRLEMK